MRKHLLPEIKPPPLSRSQLFLRAAERLRNDIAHPAAQRPKSKHRLPVPHLEPDAVPVDGDHAGVDLELHVAAQQRNRHVLRRARFVRVIAPVAGLHDVVIGQPPDGRAGPLVDRHRMQDYGLVVRDVSPLFAVLREEARVEAPRYHGVDDRVVCAVEVDARGHGEELALAARVSCPVQ